MGLLRLFVGNSDHREGLTGGVPWPSAIAAAFGLMPMGSEGDVRLFRHEAEVIAKIAPGPARNWLRPSARTA
jgi:hypothetical protein